MHYVPPVRITPKTLIDVVTGKMLVSAGACARELGVSVKTIARYIRLNEELKGFLS